MAVNCRPSPRRTLHRPAARWPTSDKRRSNCLPAQRRSICGPVTHQVVCCISSSPTHAVNGAQKRAATVPARHATTTESAAESTMGIARRDRGMRNIHMRELRASPRSPNIRRRDHRVARHWPGEDRKRSLCKPSCNRSKSEAQKWSRFREDVCPVSLERFSAGAFVKPLNCRWNSLR